MANLCGNVVVVHGPQEAVDAFEARYRNEETALSLEAIVPTPVELRTGDSQDPSVRQRRREKFGYEDAPGWAAHGGWGTKWDVDADVVERFTVGSRSAIVYRFASAGSPPAIALTTASEQHPDLTLEHIWQEPGHEYGGYREYRAGYANEVEVTALQDVALLILDCDENPAALLVDGQLTDLPAGSAGEVAEGWLRTAARFGPPGQVVVSVWDAGLDEQRDDVPDSLLALGEMLELDSASPLAMACSLPPAAQVEVLVEHDAVTSWFQEVWASGGTWQQDCEWVPRVLAEDARRLVGINPKAALTIAIAVALDMDPDEVSPAVDQVLGAGVDVAGAVRLVAELEDTVDCLDDMVTALIGAGSAAVSATGSEAC